MNNKLSKKDFVSMIMVIIILLSFATAFVWTYKLKKAHSTFENYSTYIGCVKILSKNLTSGVCTLSNGENIKIIKAQNGKWYLNGDLTFP